MLLIHLRKQRMHMREIEIKALCSINENNKDGLLALLDGYNQMLFPGLEKKKTKKDSFMDDAKAALAEEAKKVYIVKRHDRTDSDRDEYLKRMAASDNPDMKALAAKELREHRRQELRKSTRLEQMRNMGRIRSKGKKIEKFDE